MLIFASFSFEFAPVAVFTSGFSRVQVGPFSVVMFTSIVDVQNELKSDPLARNDLQTQNYSQYLAL